MPRWELAVGLLHRLGKPLPASSARDMFAHLSQATPDYAGLDYKLLGGIGRALGSGEPTPSDTRAQPR
jgi:predicted molibdopterin-dependent oxidoreductase YjgC